MDRDRRCVEVLHGRRPQEVSRMRRAIARISVGCGGGRYNDSKEDGKTGWSSAYLHDVRGHILGLITSVSAHE